MFSPRISLPGSESATRRAFRAFAARHVAESRWPRVRHARQGLRILVVDRAADTREAMGRLLRQEGHRVYTVPHAARALRVARFTRFDLLITDLGTPARPETSLLGEVARMAGRGPTPVGLVVTAMQPEDYGGELVLRSAGYAAVLLKPIRFEELHALVRGVAQRVEV